MKSHSAPSTLEEIAREFLDMFVAFFGFLTNPEAWRDVYYDVRTQSRHRVEEEGQGPRVRRNGEDRAYIYKRPQKKGYRYKYYRKSSSGGRRSNVSMKYYKRRSGEGSKDGHGSSRRNGGSRGYHSRRRKRG